MTILNVNFPRSSFEGVNDYERIINTILGLGVQITILKFNLTGYGIDLKLEVPEDKLLDVRKAFEHESIKIKNQFIEVDEDLCIDCGECIALCNTGALFFDKEYSRCFDENKCVGCHLCVDACPREAIMLR
jgi:NAD-dependent dihydropyrimidine dehydrogenase PreA subunit